MTRLLTMRNLMCSAALALLIGAAALASAQAAPADPVLQAMQAELERSKNQLRLEQMPRPYYIEYRIVDEDDYAMDVAFGALRAEQRQRTRVLRAVVRVGDYKQDSYFGTGEGTLEVAPLEDNVAALRHRIWLATDSAYKAAIESLTRKQAALKQFENEQGPDDFSREQPAVYLGPPARLEYDAAAWRATLKAVSALYRSDPELQELGARLLFRAQNRYFVNTEGTVLRQPSTVYAVIVSGSTQAADGMRLERAASTVVAAPRELPSADELRAATQKLIATLADLRKAPLAEDQYRGPVLIEPDVADAVVARLVGAAVLGRKPRPGTTSRTLGDYASSFKARVLPEFLSITDDPTQPNFGGRSLLGSYRYDDEGVAARAVPVVEKGELRNFLVGRQPIRDFPVSNGHGRSGAVQAPGPAFGNLFVRASEPLSAELLKRRLLDMCRDRGLAYGYRVESTGNGINPQLAYRVYVSDGHQELVRGAEFYQLDARALRSDLIAAGNEPKVDNRLENIGASVIAPALLFGELEIRRTSSARDKLPDYPAPALKSAAAIEK